MQCELVMKMAKWKMFSFLSEEVHVGREARGCAQGNIDPYAILCYIFLMVLQLSGVAIISILHSMEMRLGTTSRFASNLYFNNTFKFTRN